MKLNGADRSIIRIILGRVHVGISDLAAIRTVVCRMKGKRRTFLAQGRGIRRDLMRTIVRIHRENRSLYRFVMEGVR